MDWDLAIKRNSEALNAIVADLFALLGIVDGDSWADSVASLPGRAAGAPSRRIRRAAPHCRCGPGVCGGARSVPSHAQGPVKPGKADLHVPPSSSSTRRFSRIVLPRRRKSAKYPPHPLFQYRWRVDNHGPPSGRQAPARPNPLMAWSTRHASSAGSRPSRWPLRIFPARPGAWPAGGCEAGSCQTPSSNPRFGPASRPATAGSPLTSSMNSSATATGLPWDAMPDSC